jgi:hypothetical protein
MQELALTLVRNKHAYVVEPLGWRIHGVIGPVARRTWERPWSLLCSSHGVIAMRRTRRGFLPGAAVVPDHLLTFELAMRQTGLVYPRKEIASIALRRRYFKNEIKLTLTNGEETRFYLFARSETAAYRALLQRTYAPIYTESGFDQWTKYP